VIYVVYIHYGSVKSAEMRIGAMLSFASNERAQYIQGENTPSIICM
jgi:hypothetical protein